MKDKINSLVNLVGESIHKSIHDIKSYTIHYNKGVFEPESVNAAKLYDCQIADIGVTSKLISGQEDWSSPLLYLGTIIETELNASIAQAMRKIEGIDMRDYYMRYYPSKKKYRVDTYGGKQIDLNYYIIKDGVQVLSTVPIGDLCNAYQYMLENHYEDPDFYELIPEELVEEDSDGMYFTDYITDFSVYRNKAAHAGIVKIEDFDKAFKLYSRIVDEYMPALAELKRRLKTPPQS